MSLRPRRLIVVAAVAAALAAPATATAHTSPVHWIGLGSYSVPITFVDVRYEYGFTMNVEATWSHVSRTCGYLEKVSFYYYDITYSPPNGGPLWIYNNSKSRRYDSDSGQTFWSPARTTVWVNEWWCGGMSNGNLGVTTEKHNVSYFTYATDQHNSRTVWYMP
jgi:hypothetical protein